MKKGVVTTFLLFILLVGFTFDFTGADDPVPIPASKQRSGDAAKGYEYLVNGDYLKSGIPISFFRMAFGKDTQYTLGRTGNNKNIPFEFNAVTAYNGEVVVTPNCLQCHAQVFEGKVNIGMGNTFSDYTADRTIQTLMVENFLKNVKNDEGKKLAAAKEFITTLKSISPYMVVPVRGVNIADHLAALIVAHRDPVTLKWNDSAHVPKSKTVIPTDVPPWWLLKKKHAMFYNGYGRGDFGRFLMASNLLTVTDTTEAREVDGHFNDVLAYIFSIKPPAYPKPVNNKQASEGKMIFTRKCEKCHGSYGAGGDYPNLLIPSHVIQTDSLLASANFSSPEGIQWFNKSWFAMGDHPAALVPFRGYIAPPLDGIWATAPYLHNGSVPSLSMVLDSKSRPAFWKRDFKNKEYNYENPGWSYEAVNEAGGNSVYNTTLPGYSNGGHYFGDQLSSGDRKKVLEYLKTL